MTDQTDLTKLQEEMEARKAELAAVEQKMAEVKRAEREATLAAERAERLEAARKQNQELYAQYKKDAEAICTAVGELGYKLTYEEPNFDHSYFPKFNDYNIKFYIVGTYSNSYRKSSGTPAVQVKISNTSRTYKLRNDDTFNVARIAESFIENIKIRIAADKRRNDKNNRYKINKQLEQEVKMEAGVREYSGMVRGNEYKLNTVDLSIYVEQLDKARALEILQALKGLGIEFR